MARIYGARTASRAYRDHARQRRRAALRSGLKWLCYTAAAVLLCVMEGTVYAYRGTSVSTGTAPYLLPLWVMAAAMYEGPVSGAWFGIAVGLLSSAAGGDALYLLPLLYMGYGMAGGFLGRRYLKKRFTVYVAYEWLLCIVHGGLRLLAALLAAWIGGDVPGAVIRTLWSAELSDAIVSAVCALLLYLPLMLICRITAGREDSAELMHMSIEA